MIKNVIFWLLLSSNFWKVDKIVKKVQFFLHFAVLIFFGHKIKLRLFSVISNFWFGSVSVLEKQCRSCTFGQSVKWLTQHNCDWSFTTYMTKNYLVKKSDCQEQNLIMICISVLSWKSPILSIQILIIFFVRNENILRLCFCQHFFEKPESHLSLMEWTRDSRYREIVPIYRQRILHSE